MKKIFYLIASSILVPTIFWGCNKVVEKQEDTAIIVNGKEISDKEVTDAAGFLRQGLMQMSPGAAINGLNSEMRRGGARQLIANILMIEEAKRLGITADSTRKEEAYQNMVKRFGGADVVKEQLESMGETEDSFREQIRDGILVDSLLRTIMAGVGEVSKNDCREYYDTNQTEFETGPKVRVSQIHIPLDTTSDSVRENAKQKALEVRKKVADGMKFEKAVTTYSESGAKNGGDMGWFAKGDLRPDMEKVLFSLEDAEVSEVLETGNGYYIFKKTGEKPGEKLAFKDVEDQIAAMLSMKRKQEHMLTYVDSLIAGAEITYVDTNLIPTE